MEEEVHDMPAKEPTRSTAETSVVVENVRINDGLFLEDSIPTVVSGVVTASESYIGYMSVTSSDFGNSMPLNVPVQPISTALGTTTSVGIAKNPHYTNIHMPMKSSCLISHSYVQDEALTATGAFTITYGYTKS